MFLLRRLYLKLARNYRRRGILGTLRVSLDWLLGRARADHSGDFDRAHGTDTGGCIPIESVLSGASSEQLSGFVYQATPPALFDEMLGHLPIDHGRFTFLDLGSGKGMALMLASRYAFCRIIGVELSPILNEIANRNLQMFLHSDRGCLDVQSVCCNALTYPIPSGPLLLYLSNPFGPEILDKVLRRLVHSLERESAAAYLIYFNPLYSSVVSRYPFRNVIANADYAIFSYSGTNREPLDD